jgi:hypothetical protein
VCAFVKEYAGTRLKEQPWAQAGLAEPAQEVAAATERRDVQGQVEVAEWRLEAMRRAMSRESPEAIRREALVARHFPPSFHGRLYRSAVNP